MPGPTSRHDDAAAQGHNDAELNEPRYLSTQRLAEGFEAAADKLAEPYPPDVFTPLSNDEIKLSVAAMNAAVPHASDRMHAGWARHWADVLRLYARELDPEAT